MALGDAFAFDGDGDLGVVLVHGFTSTPYEMRYLGERLACGGLTVRAPLLPGHGTTIADLDGTTWRDWLRTVEESVASLRTRRVAVVGQSLGGLLALYLASQRADIAAVATLAAPLWFDGLSGRIARWTTVGPLRMVQAIPKLGGSDVRDRRVRAENPCYRAIPTRALAQLRAFMGIVDEVLPMIATPVLVLHASQDHTAPVACAARIAERTRARRVRILPRSYHLISVDIERDIVAAEVAAFVQTHGAVAARGDLSCVT